MFICNLCFQIMLFFFLICFFCAYLHLFIHFFLLLILDNSFWLPLYDSCWIAVSININILFLYTFLSSSVSFSSPVYFLLLLSALYSNLFVATYQSAISLSAGCCLLISSAFCNSMCTLGYFLLLVCFYSFYVVASAIYFLSFCFLSPVCFSLFLIQFFLY